MTRACVHPVGPTRLTQVPKRALTELGPLSYSVLRTLSRQAAFPSPQRKRQCRPWILTRSARGCVDVGDAPTNALARHSKTPACYITTWAPGEAGGRARHFVFQVHPWEKAADWTARSRNKTRSCVRRTKRRQLLRHDCSSNRSLIDRGRSNCDGRLTIYHSSSTSWQQSPSSGSRFWRPATMRALTSASNQET